MAALAAIFDIVVNWVIVGGEGLERREMRLGHRAAWNVEALADREILEIAALGKSVPMPLEALAHHDLSGKRSTPSAQSRVIVAASMPSSARMALPCSPICGAGVIAASAAAEMPGVRGVGKDPIPGWSTL